MLALPALGTTSGFTNNLASWVGINVTGTSVALIPRNHINTMSNSSTIYTFVRTNTSTDGYWYHYFGIRETKDQFGAHDVLYRYGYRLSNGTTYEGTVIPCSWLDSTVVFQDIETTHVNGNLNEYTVRAINPDGSAPGTTFVSGGGSIKNTMLYIQTVNCDTTFDTQAWNYQWAYSPFADQYVWSPLSYSSGYSYNSSCTTAVQVGSVNNNSLGHFWVQ